MAQKNDLPIIEVIQVDKSFEVKEGLVEFYASLEESIVIGPKELKDVQTGIRLKIPNGYYLLVNIDYSLFKETNLTLAGGCFIITSDSSSEEIELSLINLTRKSITVNHGDCIAVGTLFKAIDFLVKDVDFFKIRSNDEA